MIRFLLVVVAVTCFDVVGFDISLVEAVMQ